MSTPSIRLGEAYPIEIATSFDGGDHPSSETSLPSFHSLIYAPESHVKKGADIDRIDPSKPGSISVTAGRGGSNSIALVTFADTDGVPSAYSGALQPSRNEYFLLFNGRSFELRQVNSSALSMTEEKKAAERKRAPQDPSSLSNQTPAAKRSKTTESTPSPGQSAAASADSSKQLPPRAAVSFSLGGPKTPPSALASTAAMTPAPVPNPVPSASSLTKSSELRAKHRALFDEPDSDDSDSSDSD